MLKHTSFLLQQGYRIARSHTTWLRRTLDPVDFGSLRRVTPVSHTFGSDRGQCIDRHYIEQFLQANCTDIHGCVLEIGDAAYTRQFGGSRVTRSDVLHAVPGNSQATLVGDLTAEHGIPVDIFDCLILTQVLPFVYDIRTAVLNSYKALKPNGVLLATLPGICQVSRYDMDRWGDYWRFTDASARRLSSSVFGEGNVEVTVYGNVLAACAFLQGLAAEELSRHELNYVDPDYPVLITVKASKAVTTTATTAMDGPND